jgi:hypothetical protein
VVVLSLATIAAAWCTYQSVRWSGIQDFRLNAADQSERQAARFEVQADQYRTIDAALFVQYVTARTRGETALAQQFRERFRPEARGALEAWLATDPFTNPEASPTPFVMPEYHLASRQKAEALRQNAEQNYVLLTVLFTSVLFFTGICTKLPTPMLRRATLGIGVVLFGVGAVLLIGWYPVAP